MSTTDDLAPVKEQRNQNQSTQKSTAKKRKFFGKKEKPTQKFNKNLHVSNNGQVNKKKRKRVKRNFKASNGNDNDNNKKVKITNKKRAKLSPAYYDAVYILRMMSQKRGSINMLISTLKDQKNIKQVYALAIKVVKNQDVIKKIVEQFPFDEELDSILIEVLIADLIFGRGMFIQYRRTKEVLFVMERKKKITDFYQTVMGKYKSKSETKQTIRYIRPNFIKTSKDEFLQKLADADFVQVNYKKDEITFDGFKELALNLNINQFMFDYHFDDVILVNEKSTQKLTLLDIYKDGWISIQDKSSMLAIESMSLQPGMKILDACAAPGMKSLAIASRLDNDCTLYANDMNAQRYKQMRTLLHQYGVKTKMLLNLDFSKIEPTEYPDLDVILLDPSCSGTGMNRRFDYGKDAVGEVDDSPRYLKLAKFQLTLLESALKFKPKKIIYCTCSILQMENEDVINQLLNNNPNIEYEVVNLLPEWPLRGVGDYHFSSHCLRANWEFSLTGGFFCCALQRKFDTTNNKLETESVIEIPALDKTEVKVDIPKQVDSQNKSVISLEIKNNEPTETPKQLNPSSSAVRKSARIKRQVGMNQHSDSINNPINVESDLQTPRKSKRLRN